MKKVVIIGAGVSGLTAGIFLKKNGYDCEIIEKNRAAGGNLTGWNRNGYHIDNCIHWLNGSKKSSYFHSLLEEIGAINENTKFNQSKYFYVSELYGKTVGVSQNLEQTQKDIDYIKIIPVE